MCPHLFFAPEQKYIVETHFCKKNSFLLFAYSSSSKLKSSGHDVSIYIFLAKKMEAAEETKSRFPLFIFSVVCEAAKKKFFKEILAYKLHMPGKTTHVEKKRTTEP